MTVAPDSSPSEPVSESQPGTLRELVALVSRSGTYAISDVFKQAINFLLLPLYTAYLSTSDYGTLSIALAAAAVLEVFYGLGLNGAVGRLYFDQDGESGIRVFLGTLVTFLAVVGVVLTVALLAIGPFVWPLLGLNDVTFFPFIALVLLTVPLNILGLVVVLPLFYVRGQALHYAVFSLFNFALVTGGTILFVVGLERGAVGALWGRWIAALIMIVPTVWILTRHIEPGLRREMLSPALMFGLPLVPHLISNWILNFSDRIILGNFVTLDDVGIYAVGYQFGLVVAVIITGINNAWTPWYFRVNTEGRAAHVPAFATYYVMVTAGLALGAALLARPVVALMTAPAYHRAWMIVPIVVLGYFLNGLAARFLDVLLLHKRTRVIPVTTIVAGIANVGFNILVIPKWGMMGAAYGTVFGYTIRLLLTSFYAARTAALPFEWNRVFVICLWALVFAIPGVALTLRSPWLDMMWRLGLFALFPFILFVSGTITVDERRALIRGWQVIRARLT